MRPRSIRARLTLWYTSLLTLTMLHAALKGGLKPVADALAAERLAHKPESPWARKLSRRAQAIAA